ncbi:cytochrome P450 [Candidatus Solirubrobacter pratensis]|uniref:cytochrome P450 n=1 Tax=Candidatus Solirubrobacter pratensis TaxID=1298857 RepID=UPI00040EC977|nr:cytochrome P450 [Candidatus Solirubrobacter pratensis]
MLPPGPREPAALQTVEWILRPTALLRRAQARYGEPFTIRTAWSDAPMVLVSDPAEIKRVYAASPDMLQGGESAAFLEPFTGPSSILVLHGEEHLRRRRQVLPPFHGDALRRWSATMAEIAHAELDTWEPGRPLRARERMQRLTLEVIQRVVFGSRDEELRDALRRALDMTNSTPKLVGMSLTGPTKAFMRAVAQIDELLLARIAEARRRQGFAVRNAFGGLDSPVDPQGRASSAVTCILDLLAAAEPSDRVLRDQLVTLLAAGHETTATALAWALERLARHPEALARCRDDDAYVDATAKEVLRVRPVLSITSRRVLQPWTVGGYTLPPGVYVSPCLYLAHRRPELWPDPTGFRPERFLDGAPEPYSWVPFGGGTRRCLGAAFASLELREVLRAVASRFALRPDRAAGERMRRRSVTLAPARGAVVIPNPLA